MIRLPEKDLPEAARRRLASWQSDVDALTSHAERVREARLRFRQRNTSRNATFVVVRQRLTDLCSGARRCGYCEDSGVDEIDHIWPKDLYPEQVFAWRNFLYACGGCNVAKRDAFAVFPGRARSLLEVGRTHRDVMRPPPAGVPGLIDPRGEDPMELLGLDLLGTFRILPLGKKGTRGYARAAYSLRVLQLNREVLTVARREAFFSYRARLAEYVSLKERDASAKDLALRVQAIQRASHPTVWREMQRMQKHLPQLRALFRKAPEALAW
ncbi:hypothetical protein [Myxococcus sp. AB025B]|uniref:hypothetical protein n=1 Tax=Myxococcus sp. AB025B TaxID=2562794 RepID=UPI00114411DB|nr:hypothetical protein [Myxococcus sp. AB025B]